MRKTISVVESRRVSKVFTMADVVHGDEYSRWRRLIEIGGEADASIIEPAPGYRWFVNGWTEDFRGSDHVTVTLHLVSGKESAAIIVDPLGGGDFATIQEAVDEGVRRQQQQRTPHSSQSGEEK